MDTHLLKLLEDAGLTEKEAWIYLALLELGQAKVADIAKKVELKRPIVYVVLESLIKRGYVSELPNKKINTYQAIDPSIILKSIQTTAKNLSEMLPILRTLGSTGKRRPKISFFNTKEGILNIYNEIDYAKKAFFIESFKRLKQIFPGIVEQWAKNIKTKHYASQTRHLIANDPEEIEIGKKFLISPHEVKCLGLLKDLKMDFSIYDNKLAITSLEDEPFIVVIESEEVVKSMMLIFEIAWRNAKTLK